MLVDTDNLVTEADFRAHLDRHLETLNSGGGPVVVTRDSRVVGVLLSPQEYEALCGTAIRDLLKSREIGPTVSHEDARAHLQGVIDRRRKA